LGVKASTSEFVEDTVQSSALGYYSYFIVLEGGKELLAE
jgi:hypothetical protein